MAVADTYQIRFSAAAAVSYYHGQIHRIVADSTRPARTRHLVCQYSLSRRGRSHTNLAMSHAQAERIHTRRVVGCHIAQRFVS